MRDKFHLAGYNGKKRHATMRHHHFFLFAARFMACTMAYSVIGGFLMGGMAFASSSLLSHAGCKSIEAVYARVKQNPVLLQMFLRDFPKGADLHNHLVGAVYAESFLRWAGEDGLCIALNHGMIMSSSCGVSSRIKLPAASLERNESAWNYMVDALSMRDFVLTAGDRSGHDHFFATFARFEALEAKHQGDMLAEALDHAAQDHVQYVELMISPALGTMIHAGKTLTLHTDADIPAADQALSPLIEALVAQARKEVDAMERQAQERLQCGTVQARPACQVKWRYLFQSVRTLPPNMLYPQLVAGYALVKADPRFVGINIVAPEDDPIAMRDYDLHMQMFHYLNVRFPEVNLSLHAGELTPALVPPEGLDHHIRAAIEQAGAKRIGHGVDILWEHDPENLLAEMAQQKIMVEINLTSNEEILGIRGLEHPFTLYRQAGVPVALSTDDEGVSRGSLTQEYRLAVQRYGLSYADLVLLSRSGLEYAFIPGKSLWEGHHLGKEQAVCHGALHKKEKVFLPVLCRVFLEKNLKAELQWELEMKLAVFEEEIPRRPLYVSSPSSAR